MNDINDLDVTKVDEPTWRRMVWGKLNSTETQTIQTNGRVNRLERWMWMSVGGLAVVSAIVVPLFLKAVLAK